jgi:hypothetical protein
MVHRAKATVLMRVLPYGRVWRATCRDQLNKNTFFSGPMEIETED